MSLLFPILLLVALPLDPPAEETKTTAALPAVALVAPLIDPQAEALLVANEQAMFALRSFAARCDTILRYPPTQQAPQGTLTYECSRLVAAKPNLMRYDQWTLEKKRDKTGNSALVKAAPVANFTFTSDAKRSFRQFGMNYRQTDLLKPEELYTLTEPWGGFYSPLASKRTGFDLAKKANHLKELRLLPPQTVGGVRCKVIGFRYHADVGDGPYSSQEYEGKLFLGPDNLVRREVQSIQIGKEPPFLRDAILSNIRADFATPPVKTFAYTPPRGALTDAQLEAAQKVQAENAAELASRAAEAMIPQPALLANGTKAPDFTVEDINGKPVKLSDFRGKTVILDFWATWCGPCLMAMPGTNAAGQKFKNRNVVVVAVNVWDTRAAYQKWVPKNQSRFRAVRFLFDPHGRKGDVAKSRYNVSGIPTQYVIDPQGVIRASLVGYDADPSHLDRAIVAAAKATSVER